MKRRKNQGGPPKPAPAASQTAPEASTPRWALPAACGLLALAALGAYANSFDGQFVYDDRDAVRDNKHIRTLWPLSEATSWPGRTQDSTLARRPLLSFTFALNRTLFGPGVASFHAVNLAIHLGVALLLMGIVRRTLLLPPLGDRWAAASAPLALAAALLWLLHPLHTASVTYIAQRAESLVSLLLALTLYAAIRAFGSPAPFRWRLAAVLACLAGALVKELIVVAPLLVLLYDRTFLAGSFAAALRKRPAFYAALAASWLVLAALAALTADDTARSFESNTLWAYAATQPGVVLYYLWLAVWPSPLLADYGWPDATGLAFLIPAAVIAAGLTLTAWGLWRRRIWAFAPACFFLILAPSSSFVALFQNVQLQRMYLPLAALIVPGVLAAGRLLKGRALLGAILTAALAGAWGYATALRNADYRDPVAFWQDNVQQRPQGYRAWTNLGISLGEAGKMEEAVTCFQRALDLTGKSALAEYNLALAMKRAGRLDEASAHFQAALALREAYPEAHLALGETLASKARGAQTPPAARPGILSDAVRHFRRASQLNPASLDAWRGLGEALAGLGRYEEALAALRKAMDLRGENAEDLFNIGVALHNLKRPAQAIDCFYRSLALTGDRPETHRALAIALEGRKQYAQAAAHYEKVVALQPESPQALNSLAWLLATHNALAGGEERAVELARKACQLTNQSNVTYLATLAATLAAAGRFDQALAAADQALALARTAGDPEALRRLQQHLDLYRQGKSLRQGPGAGDP